MKHFIIVAVLIAAALVSANAQDCAGKPDGDYPNPRDCNGFISCTAGVATERVCANCHVEPGRCPDGRLVYNATRNACLFADETSCETGGVTQTPPVGTTTVATTTTRVPGTTEKPGTDPQPGQPCDPMQCFTKGYCQSYLRCDKVTSKWVQEECGLNLVWNPLNPNETAQIHGGNCDVWESLTPDLEHKYRTDEDCLGCFWRELGECNTEYEYQPVNGTHRNVLRLSCSQGLVFSKEKETCLRCQDARKQNGSPCC